jgi:hypothetical protein
MDANKRQELLNIGYVIQGNCRMCVHGRFHENAFGVCGIHTYHHLKHTGDKRQLSIHESGRCSKIVLAEKETGQLGLWQEFVKV